jgi:hypothetical protein
MPGGGRDIALPSGYTHLSSSTSSTIPVTRDLYSSRVPDPRMSAACSTSRLGLPTSMSISGTCAICLIFVVVFKVPFFYIAYFIISIAAVLPISVSISDVHVLFI